MDNKTGLVWLKDANVFGVMNWNDAVKKVNELNQNFEKSKWRLPALGELLNLCYNDSGNFIKPDAPFTKVQSAYYWSSSTDSGNPILAWNVNLVSGFVNYHYKTISSYYVWPVRGGQ